MPTFQPGEVKIARVSVTVVPSGMACQLKLFLGPNDTTEVVSGVCEFTSQGNSQEVSIPITMPIDPGTYNVYLDMYAEGSVIAAYQATEGVEIQESGYKTTKTDFIEVTTNVDGVQASIDSPNTDVRYGRLGSATPVGWTLHNPTDKHLTYHVVMYTQAEYNHTMGQLIDYVTLRPGETRQKVVRSTWGTYTEWFLTLKNMAGTYPVWIQVTAEILTDTYQPTGVLLVEEEPVQLGFITIPDYVYIPEIRVTGEWESGGVEYPRYSLQKHTWRIENLSDLSQYLILDEYLYLVDGNYARKNIGDVTINPHETLSVESSWSMGSSVGYRRHQLGVRLYDSGWVSQTYVRWHLLVV